jgi:2-phospho-L-lactate guanylyltransferase
MTKRAIVPVKPFSKGKSRLSASFEPEVLYRLNVKLFFRTLQTVLGSQVFDEVLVISRSKRALSWAEQKGASTLFEQSPRGLNSAVNQAMLALDNRDLGDILVLPTDLPLMTTEDIRGLVTLIDTPGITIVPDRHQAGTNAICMSGGLRITPSFGNNSFQKHCAQALAQGYPLTVWLNEHIGQDLDTDFDLEIIQSQTDLTETLNNNYLKG